MQWIRRHRLAPGTIFGLAALVGIALLVVVLASLSFGVRDSEAATTGAAKRAVKRELRQEYSWADSINVRCSKLTPARFRCGWYVVYGDYSIDGGTARARKYTFGWDVSLRVRCVDDGASCATYV